MASRGAARRRALVEATRLNRYSLEVLALRKILLNLQFTVAAGEPVTRERMLAWIEEADADKGEKARARLSAAAG